MASIASRRIQVSQGLSPERRGLQNPRSNLKTKLDRYKTALPTVAPSSGIVAWSSHGCSSGSVWPLAAVTWLTDSIRQHQQASRQAGRRTGEQALLRRGAFCIPLVQRRGARLAKLAHSRRLPDCPPTWFVPEDNPSPSPGVAAGKQRHLLRGRCHPQGPQHSRASLRPQAMAFNLRALGNRELSTVTIAHSLPSLRALEIRSLPNCRSLSLCHKTRSSHKLPF